MSDSDPSFIRTNAGELFNFARRLGMSNDQVRDAVDAGLIKPAATTKVRPEGPAAADAGADSRDRPDIAI
jgi:hypothetical protein